MAKSPRTTKHSTNQLLNQAQYLLQRNAEWFAEFEERIRDFKILQAEFEKEHPSSNPTALAALSLE